MRETVKNELLQIFRYIASGLPVVFTFYFIYISSEAFGLWYIAAAWLGFGGSVLVNFFLQKFFVFKEDSIKRTGNELFIFLVGSFMARVVNSGVLYALVEYGQRDPITAQVFITITIAVIGYIFSRFVFRPTPMVT